MLTLNITPTLTLTLTLILIFILTLPWTKKTIITRDANLANRFAVFLGLKISILDEKTVFSPIVQYTCVVINLERNSIFLNPAVFSSKTVQNTAKKEHMASLHYPHSNSLLLEISSQKQLSPRKCRITLEKHAQCTVLQHSCRTFCSKRCQSHPVDFGEGGSNYLFAYVCRDTYPGVWERLWESLKRSEIIWNAWEDVLSMR